ncbi:MFS transporter [Egicoccus sp. AB-alg2]|uniref:MFS transporter n=1 Tax=Egicoccus sp. AB-alg2 TaxID=3242693 RepID=UPI00359D78F2
MSVATLLYWTAAHALRPLVPLHLDALGASEATVGLVIALFPLSSLGLAIPSGRLVDRVGVRRVLAFGLVGMVSGGVGFAVAPTVAAVAAFTVLIGLAELATWVSLQAYASEGGRGDFLTRQLALFSLAWGGGIAGGPIIGTLLYDRYGFSAVGVCYALCGTIAVVALWVAPRVGRPAVRERRSVRSGIASMWATLPVRATLLSSFVALFVQGIKASFLPLYLERAGLDVPLIGVLLSVSGIAALVVRLPLPRVVRRLGPGRALVLSMWLAVVPMGLFPFTRGFAVWLALAVFVGVGLGANPPITVELMARHTDAAERGVAMGLRLTANRLAQVIQPIAFGALVSAAGFATAFTAATGALAVITGWTSSLRDALAPSGDD